MSQACNKITKALQGTQQDTQENVMLYQLDILLLV